MDNTEELINSNIILNEATQSRLDIRHSYSIRNLETSQSEILDKAALKREFPNKDSENYPLIDRSSFIGWRLLDTFNHNDCSEFIATQTAIYRTNPDAWIGEFRIGLCVMESVIMVFVDEDCPDLYLCNPELKAEIVDIIKEVVVASTVKINFPEILTTIPDQTWWYKYDDGGNIYAPYDSTGGYVTTTTSSGWATTDYTSINSSASTID